ncbi:hypothetical protein B7494_g6256 [Chlorociboria aeruginascens]|nr:hypothetical protein B7494_g6256 [Chlorociboria aeruginascens]
MGNYTYFIVAPLLALFITSSCFPTQNPPTSKNNLIYITLEEHYTSAAMKPYDTDAVYEILASGTALYQTAEVFLQSINGSRIESMNNNSIQIQVVSNDPNPVALEVPQAATDANNELAAAIAPYPDRFRGFCFLPMGQPVAAAQELQRCVSKLGFLGALVDSHLINGTFYDGPEYDPLWSMLERLGVPIYLHPTYPLIQQVTGAGGLYAQDNNVYPDPVAAVLGTAGWGWHSDCGLQFLRLWRAGVFDRHPRLKVVLGHMGEMLPFMLARSSLTFGATKTTGLTIPEAYAQNIWITTSGFFSLDPFTTLWRTTAKDRIMYSVDYPWAKMEYVFLGNVARARMMPQYGRDITNPQDILENSHKISYLARRRPRRWSLMAWNLVKTNTKFERQCGVRTDHNHICCIKSDNHEMVIAAGFVRRIAQQIRDMIDKKTRQGKSRLDHSFDVSSFDITPSLATFFVKKNDSRLLCHNVFKQKSRVPRGEWQNTVGFSVCLPTQGRFRRDLWVQADESSKIALDFSQIALSLGLVADKNTEEAPCLLIFDNVDDADILDGYLPTVLITTRDPIFKTHTFAGESQQSDITLPSFDEDKVMEYILKLAHRKKESEEHESGKAIAANTVYRCIEPPKFLLDLASIRLLKFLRHGFIPGHSLIAEGNVLPSIRLLQTIPAAEYAEFEQTSGNLHPVAKSLQYLVERDGAGTWPPRTSYGKAWPKALQPYHDVYRELAPLLPWKEMSGNDQKNYQRSIDYRAKMRALLHDRVDLKQVEKVLFAAQNGDNTILPGEAWNGLFACIATTRHAYRWGTIPIVRLAQEEKALEFPPELDAPWPYLQKRFGVVSQGGNVTSNYLCAFNDLDQLVYPISSGMSPTIQWAQYNFAHVFPVMEAQSLQIYHWITRSICQYSKGDQVGVLQSLCQINNLLRKPLKTYYDTLTEPKISKSVWLHYVQGVQGWGIGTIDPVTKVYTEYDGLSGNQLLLLHVMDAFLGVEPPYLSKANALRYMPRSQRNFSKCVSVHSFRYKAQGDGADEVEKAFGKIVKQMKLFRTTHRNRVKPYLSVPAPERMIMTAGKGVLESQEIHDLETAIAPLDDLLRQRLDKTK